MIFTRRKTKRNDVEEIIFSKKVFSNIIIKFAKKITQNRIVDILLCVRKMAQNRIRKKIR